MNNWFDTKSDGTKDRYFGKFVIENGEIDLSDCDIKNGQYFRIIGSVYNDGVHQYPPEGLVDEEFDGAVWLMRVPPQVISLLSEILAWDEKYGPIVDSPFNSESFGGYSYYKGYRNRATATITSWKGKFAEKINKWRKLRTLRN